MKRLARLTLFLLPVGFAAVALAQEPVAKSADADAYAGLPADVVALLTGKTKWSTEISAEAAFGYNDNVALSFTRPERSAFARYAVEAFAWHLPRGGTDYIGMLSAEQTRYFSAETVKHEASAIGFVQWRHRWGEWLKFAFDLRGFYQDAVFDVSDTDVVRTVVQQKRAGGTAGPTLRLAPRPWAWLEVQALGTRDWFEDQTDDSKLGEGLARLGSTLGEQLEFSVGTADRRRRYQRREQYTLGGRPFFGRLLVIAEREHDARIEATWGAVNRWRSVTRAGVLDYDDNGPGYFNYRRKFVGQKLEWRNDVWRIGVDGTAKRADFEFQTVGSGLAPPPRVKDLYEARLRIERKLGRRWTAYAIYSWERSRSNDVLASYRSNEGLLGARWSWEK